MSTTAAPPLTTARILSASFRIGVGVFAVVAWVLTGGGARPLAGDDAMAMPLTYAWIAVAFGTALGAIVVWRMRVGPVLTMSAATPAEERRTRHGALLTGLIVVWALLEAQALAGIVVFLLTGAALPFWGGLAVMGVGTTVSRPRAEWYRER